MWLSITTISLPVLSFFFPITDNYWIYFLLFIFYQFQHCVTYLVLGSNIFHNLWILKLYIQWILRFFGFLARWLIKLYSKDIPRNVDLYVYRLHDSNGANIAWLWQSSTSKIHGDSLLHGFSGFLWIWIFQSVMKFERRLFGPFLRFPGTNLEVIHIESTYVKMIIPIITIYFNHNPFRGYIASDTCLRYQRLNKSKTPNIWHKLHERALPPWKFPILVVFRDHQWEILHS